MTRLMTVLLGFCAVLLGLLLLAAATGAGRDAPLTHPEFGPMQVGIDAGQLGAPTWAAYLAGLAILGTMWIAMLIGFRPRHWIHRAVNAWFVGYLLLFVLLMWSFGAYAAGETRIILGFTAPTALLVYGLTLAPWIPLVAVTWAYEDAYFGPVEQARFEEILAETKAGARARSGARTRRRSGARTRRGGEG